MLFKQITALLFSLGWLFAGQAIAQSPADSVQLALNDYIDAFYYGDTSKIYRSIDPGVHKYGYYRPRNGNTYAGEAMPFQEMIDYAKAVFKKGKNPNVEKFPRQVEVYDVLDQTACGKVTAWWGTDYVLLAKLDGHWKITNVVWQSPVPKQ